MPTRTSRGRRAAKAAAVALSVCVVAATATGYATFHHYLGKLQRIDVFAADRNRPAAAAYGSENFLLVGSDSRAGLTRKEIDKYHLGLDIGGQRSDTMIILHVSQRHDRALLVSLPRDSYVEIPAFTTSTGQHVAAHRAKLNSAYSEGGAQLALQTVERATGVRIDHYVEINVLGFARMVDALGGVEVCLTKPVDDPKSGLHLGAGDHLVNGTQGLAFVRARHAFGDGSDLGRIKRQQQFLGAMMRRALSTGTLLDLGKLNGFLNAALASVQVDSELQPGDIRTLVLAMRHLDPKHVTFLTVPLSNVNDNVPGVGSTVLWDPTLSRVLFGALRDDTALTAAAITPPKLTAAPQQITVQVQNGTRRSGLAASVTGSLAAAGFHTEPASNADSQGYATTVVRYAPGQAAAARTVAAALPGSSVRQDSTAGNAVVVVLGDSFSTVAPVSVSSSAAPRSTAKPAFDTTTAADNACSKA